VRRREHARAAPDQLGEQHPREGRAVLGVGSRAGLVEEHERAGGRPREDLREVPDVAGEGREVARDGLRIADVGPHRVEERETGARVRQHRNPRLRHEHREAEGLQGDALAAGVRPADEQQSRAGGELDVDRRDGSSRLDEERMAGAPEHHLLAADLRTDGGALPREEHPGAEGVEGDERRERLVQRVRAAADHGGDLAEDARLLLRLLARGDEQAVVRLDREERLDEERLAGRRAILDDPGELVGARRLERNDEATVPDGHVLVGHELGGRRLAEQPRETRLDLPAEEAQLAADGAQRGARVVAEPALLVQAVGEEAVEIRKRVQRAEKGEEPGVAGGAGAKETAHLADRGDHLGDLAELAPGEERARRARRGRVRADVRQLAERRPLVGRDFDEVGDAGQLLADERF
jgi:hypothetical protein